MSDKILKYIDDHLDSAIDCENKYEENLIKALRLAVTALNYVNDTVTKHGAPYAYDVVNDNIPEALKEIAAILGVDEVAK